MSGSKIIGGVEVERCAACQRLALCSETIAISLSEYKALKAIAATVASRKDIAFYRGISKSRIARDPALAEFIIEAARTMTASGIAIACREKFGSQAPSQSAIHRFVRAVLA